MRPNKDDEGLGIDLPWWAKALFFVVAVALVGAWDIRLTAKRAIKKALGFPSAPYRY